MNKILFTTAVFLLFATATIQAQQDYVAYTGKSNDAYKTTSPAFKSASMALLERRNIKAYNDFTSKYGVAVDANIITDASNTTVVFTNEGILTRIYYKLSGEYSGTIRYYDAAALPAAVTNTVKAAFNTYTITGVTELANAEQKTVYMVKIENDKNWKTVQVVDNETFVTEQFKKGK